jgi:hypothetical protein
MTDRGSRLGAGIGDRARQAAILFALFIATGILLRTVHKHYPL